MSGGLSSVVKVVLRDRLRTRRSPARRRRRDGASRGHREARVLVIGVLAKSKLKLMMADRIGCGASRMAAPRGPMIVSVGGPLPISPSSDTGQEWIGLVRAASAAVRYVPTCNEWIAPRFDSVHSGRPDVRGIGTGRAPLVTGSRVACSGVRSGSRSGLGRFGDQLAAEPLIRPGLELVGRTVPALAPERSIQVARTAMARGRKAAALNLGRGRRAVVSDLTNDSFGDRGSLN